MRIPIEISARHVHLSKEDKEKLFGHGFKLTLQKKLSQPGEFACKETVTLIGPKRKMENVRIIGPERSQTQVEISKSDGFYLGEIPPVRLSGDLVGTSGITLSGPKGKVRLNSGLICAMRHIHMSLKEARQFKVKNGQIVSVEIKNQRALIYKNVMVRVSPKFRLAFQLDTDEANAGAVETGDEGELII